MFLLPPILITIIPKIRWIIIAENYRAIFCCQCSSIPRNFFSVRWCTLRRHATRISLALNTVSRFFVANDFYVNEVRAMINRRIEK